MTEPAPGLTADQPAPPAPRQIDWERIEIEFRAGYLTLREIAARHGTNHTAIRRRAQREGWDRDIQGKIRAKAAALLSKQSVFQARVPGTPSEKQALTERHLVSAEAELIAGIQARRRARADRLNAAFEAALAVVEKGSMDLPILGDLRRLAEAMPAEQRAGALMQINNLEEVMAADALVGRLQRLMQSGSVLSETEADVYGLSHDAPAGSVPAGLDLFYPASDAPPEKPGLV
jgi:hypothetical protein